MECTTPRRPKRQFSAIASGLFILPFFVLSALSGLLADMRDKAKIIRWIKLAEIGIMLCGGGRLVARLVGASDGTVAIPLMLLALLAMGVHSTFFGPIKYAILPQHLHKDEVLAGTGLVEAGTSLAILAAPSSPAGSRSSGRAGGVVVTAALGYLTSLSVPPAPPPAKGQPLDWHVIRVSIALVRNTMHDARGVLCDPGDQLLLDHRRGAVHPVSAAGQERAAGRQASRQPVPGDLLDRRGDRLGRRERAAQGRGLRPLCPGLGAGDGPVRGLFYLLCRVWTARPFAAG